MLSKFVDSVKNQNSAVVQLNPYSCTTITPELYNHSLYSRTTAALWSYNYRSFVLQGAYNTI